MFYLSNKRDNYHSVYAVLMGEVSGNEVVHTRVGALGKEEALDRAADRQKR